MTVMNKVSCMFKCVVHHCCAGLVLTKMGSAPRANTLRLSPRGETAPEGAKAQLVLGLLLPHHQAVGALTLRNNELGYCQVAFAAPQQPQNVNNEHFPPNKSAGQRHACLPVHVCQSHGPSATEGSGCQNSGPASRSATAPG